jgi:hypothetical protein
MEERTEQFLGDFELSQETDKIFPAFVKFQSELDFAKKSGENPFYDGAKYAELKDVLAALKEPLANNKLAIMQFPVVQGFVKAPQKVKVLKKKNGKYGEYEQLTWTGEWTTINVREILLTTFLIHESGQWIKSWYLGTPSDNESQSRGKCITYSRKYTIMALSGICGDDDDANPTPKTTTPATTKKGPPPPPKPKEHDYVKDKNGVLRFDKTDKRLNDEYQKKNDLIETTKWLEISSLIQKNIGGAVNIFAKWLMTNYGVNFFDIKNVNVGEIIYTLQNSPQDIMNNVVMQGDPVEENQESDGLPY